MRTNGGERAYEVDTTGLIHLCGDSMALLSKARQRGRPPESRRATPAVERALERKRKPSPTAHGPSPRKGRQDVSRRDRGEGRRDPKYQLGLCILTSSEGMWLTNLGGPSLRNRFRFEGCRVCTKGRGRPPPAHSRACKHAYGPKRHAAALFNALPTSQGGLKTWTKEGKGGIQHGRPPPVSTRARSLRACLSTGVAWRSCSAQATRRASRQGLGARLDVAPEERAGGQ